MTFSMLLLLFTIINFFVVENSKNIIKSLIGIIKMRGEKNIVVNFV